MRIRKKKLHKNMGPRHGGLGTERGFTLVEIMIAIFVFSVGLLAVASMQISGTKGTANAKRHTIAATWASDRIEKLISLPYNHPDLADGTNAQVTEDLHTIAWTVTQNQLINNTKTILVTVTWNDGAQDRNVSFTYYKADI